MKPKAAPEVCDECPVLQDEACMRDQAIKLSNYRPGDKGHVLQVCGRPEFRLRMLEMGLVKGEEIQVVKYAPLADPIEFIVKGYHLTLRREEAADIIMDRPSRAA